MSAKTMSIQLAASTSSASRPLAASKISPQGSPDMAMFLRTTARMIFESSTIKML